MAKLRFFSQPKTIYECSGLLCRVHLFGCTNALWWPRTGRRSNADTASNENRRFVVNVWTRLYSLGVGILLLSVLSYVVLSKFADPEQSVLIARLDSLLLSIVCLELCATACAFVVCMLSMQSQAHHQLRLYERIQAIDRRLIDEFGADLNYGKLKCKNLLLITGFSCVHMAAVIATGVQMSHGDGGRMFVGAVCYVIMTGATHMNGYAHINLTDILRIRFRLLQRLLTPAYLRSRFPENDVRVQRLHSAVEMVKELHELVAKINEVFMLSLLATLAHDFTLTTSEMYIIFSSSIGTHTNYLLLINVCVCMLTPLYKMLAAPFYCHMTTTEGKKCLLLIEKLDTCFKHNNVVRCIVSSTMFWRRTHTIEFTAGLNIVMNKTLVTIITVVIFNYLLILIQFRITQDMVEHNINVIEEQKKEMQDWIGANA